MKVGVRELKNRLSHYLDLAQKGEEIIVTDRGTEVAIILPAQQNEVEAKVSQLVREGIATWGGGKPLGAVHPVPGRGRPVSEMVIEDRR